MTELLERVTRLLRTVHENRERLNGSTDLQFALDLALYSLKKNRISPATEEKLLSAIDSIEADILSQMKGPNAAA